MKSHLQIPLILILVSLTSIVSSQQWAPGLPEDTPFPNINVLDQHGETWTNKTLVGEKGLIFFFCTIQRLVTLLQKTTLGVV